MAVWRVKPKGDIFPVLDVLRLVKYPFLLGMVLAHVLSVFYSIKIATGCLPVMALGCGLGLHVTRNRLIYVGRVVGIGLLAELVWFGSGVSAGIVNDVLIFGVALGAIALEDHLGRPGVLAVPLVFILGFLGLQWVDALLVMVAWFWAGDMVAISVVYMAVAVITSVQFGPVWLVWGLVVPLVASLRGIRLQLDYGKWHYWVYPGHLGLIALVRAVS